MIDRRDFMTRAAAVGAGAMAIPVIGCAPTLRGAQVRTLTETESDDIAARLRRSVTLTRDVAIVSPLVPEAKRAADAGLRGRLAHADALATKAIQALLIADAGGRVPRDAHPDDALARCFEGYAPMLDEAVVSHTAMLERAPVREKRRVDEFFRRTPDAAMQVGEALDAHARSAEVSADSRGKMRRIFAEITTRARAQSFSTVSEEYVGKVHRVAALRGQDAALAQAVASRGSSRAVWNDDTEVAPALPPPPPVSYRPSYHPPTEPASTPGQNTVRHGLIVSGIGLATFGLFAGVLALGARSAGVAVGLIGMTVGAVTLLVGLIMMLVGAIMRAAE